MFNDLLKNHFRIDFILLQILFSKKSDDYHVMPVIFVRACRGRVVLKKKW